VREDAPKRRERDSSAVAARGGFLVGTSVVHAEKSDTIRIGHAVEAKARVGVGPPVALAEGALDGATSDTARRDERAVDVEEKDGGRTGAGL